MYLHWIDGKQLVNNSGGKDKCLPYMPTFAFVWPICFEASIEGHFNVFGDNLL